MTRAQHLILFLFVQGTFSLPLFRTAAPIPKKKFTIVSTIPLAGSSSGSSKSYSKSTFSNGKDTSNGHHHHDHDKDRDDKRRHVHLILPKKWMRLLYAVSAFNPFIAVFFNDYSSMLEFAPGFQSAQHIRLLARTYETIFFFAKLKPRVTFAIGAALRALQLTTALQYVFDPMIGVGFGLNLLCLYAKSRWPATIVLGWALTKPLWKVLGANPPSGLPVPISITLKSNRDERDKVATVGYRIGIGK